MRRPSASAAPMAVPTPSAIPACWRSALKSTRTAGMANEATRRGPRAPRGAVGESQAHSDVPARQLHTPRARRTTVVSTHRITTRPRLPRAIDVAPPRGGPAGRLTGRRGRDCRPRSAGRKALTPRSPEGVDWSHDDSGARHRARRAAGGPGWGTPVRNPTPPGGPRSRPARPGDLRSRFPHGAARSAVRRRARSLPDRQRPARDLLPDRLGGHATGQRTRRSGHRGDRRPHGPVRMARDMLVSGLLAYFAADLVKNVVGRE